MIRLLGKGAGWLSCTLLGSSAQRPPQVGKHRKRTISFEHHARLRWLLPQGVKLEGGEKPRKPAAEAKLTPDSNKALVRRWLEEVFTRGDPDAAGGLFTSNYTLHRPSFTRDVYGPEGIERYVSAYRVALSDLEVTVGAQLAEEGKVVSPVGRRGGRIRARSWGWRPLVRRWR